MSATEYTVHALAQLAGVTERTLRWYDKIGLLKPARTTEAGYRLYGAQQVDALQSILCWRALGVPLAEIAALEQAPDADRTAQLQRHRAALAAERDRLTALLATLDKTMQAQKGEIAMTDKEKFEGFKRDKLAQNEAQYGAEAREKYGDAAVDAANERFAAQTQTQYDSTELLGERIKSQLAAAVRAGEDPAGEIGQQIAALHKEWLCRHWSEYTPQAHRGVAQMYVSDPRFTAYYDAEVPGCARFLYDAVYVFTK